MATLSVKVPASDTSFFMKLMKKMGWEVKTAESLLQQYIESRSKESPLTEEDIMNEVKAIRYNK